MTKIIAEGFCFLIFCDILIAEGFWFGVNKTMKENVKRSSLKKKAPYFIFLVLPYLIINLSSSMGKEWLGRLIAVSIFFMGVIVVSFWFALNPKLKIIQERGKLNNPEFVNIKPKIEAMIRLLIFAFGIFFILVIIMPFEKDLRGLVLHKSSEIIEHRVTDWNTGFMGTWFLMQKIKFEENKGADRYYLFFSWPIIKLGKIYKFVVLQYSRIILEARP